MLLAPDQGGEAGSLGCLGVGGSLCLWKVGFEFPREFLPARESLRFEGVGGSSQRNQLRHSIS